MIELKNKIKMLISGSIVIIFTALTFSNLCTWIFHLYPSFPGYPIYSYFGAVLFYGLISVFCWPVARGYYLDYQKENKSNTKNTWIGIAFPCIWKNPSKNPT